MQHFLENLTLAITSFEMLILTGVELFAMAIFKLLFVCHNTTDPRNFRQLKKFWIGKIEYFGVFFSLSSQHDNLTVDIKKHHLQLFY